MKVRQYVCIRIWSKTMAAAVVADPDGPLAVLDVEVVRFLGEAAGDDGEEEDDGDLGDGLVRLSGQHQLLGWSLESEDIRFLANVGAGLQVYEYG